MPALIRGEEQCRGGSHPPVKRRQPTNAVPVYRYQFPRRQPGQALIETVAGLILLIPLALFSYDLTFVLISNQNNERLAENAARAAANHLTSLSAQQAAQQAVDNFNQSAGTNNISLTNFSYDLSNEQIILTTQMEVTLPVPLASWKTMTIQAQSIVPIVAIPAPI